MPRCVPALSVSPLSHCLYGILLIPSFCFPCVSVAKLQLADCFTAIYHCIVYNVSLRYLQCFLPTIKKRRFPLYSFRGLPHPCPNTISACAKRKHQLVFCEAIESGSFGNSRIKANAYSVCQNDCLSVSSFYTLLICGLCLFGKNKVLLVLEAKKCHFSHSTKQKLWQQHTIKHNF